MSDNIVHIRFETPTSAQASLYAQELRQSILNAAPKGVQVSVKKADPETMLLGDGLEIWAQHTAIALLAETMVAAIFEGIRVFKEKRKVPILVEAGGKSKLVDRVEPELAEWIKAHLPPSPQD